MFKIISGKLNWNFSLTKENWSYDFDRLNFTLCNLAYDNNPCGDYHHRPNHHLITCGDYHQRPNHHLITCGDYHHHPNHHLITCGDYHHHPNHHLITCGDYHHHPYHHLITCGDYHHHPYHHLIVFSPMELSNKGLHRLPNKNNCATLY